MILFNFDPLTYRYLSDKENKQENYETIHYKVEITCAIYAALISVVV